MKNILLAYIILILLCLVISPVTGDTGDNAVNTISQTLAIPPTGTALPGTQGSMTQYESWLNQCAAEITGYSTMVLQFFGVSSLPWSQNIPAAATPAVVSTTAMATLTAGPALSIPEIPERTTLLKVTGADGWETSDTFAVNGPYWELWYTADPQITGGQDTTSPSASYSAVFPSLSIQVIDASNNTVIETIEPPGGLDKTLWERTGIDPRPWLEKFNQGYSQYYLKISATNVNAYLVEARVPSRPEQYGPTDTISTTPTATVIRKNYVIACRVYREGSSVDVIFSGGSDAASLQYITLTENGQILGTLGDPGSPAPLKIGAEGNFPVSDPDPGWYVIGMGHFLNGDTQKVFETTLEPSAY